MILFNLLLSAILWAQTNAPIKVDRVTTDDANIPAAAVMPFATPTCPEGWLEANGSQISRTQYSELFKATGTIHGTGNGSTTFHLPDYRGRFLRGAALGQGADPDRGSRTSMNTGGNTGDNVGSIQGQQIVSHGHTRITRGGANIAGSGSPNNAYAFFSTALTSGAAGGNETRPVNAYVIYCIKL